MIISSNGSGAHDALASAVAETEAFVGAAGWDQPVQLFALVETATLIEAEPTVSEQLDPASRYTPIAQDALPDRDIEAALATVGWPPAVVGCVLVQEIVVLPPQAAAVLDDSDDPAAVAAAHPERSEARLAVGVLRTGAVDCLLRVRGDHEADPVRSADLAPNLSAALLATFEE